MKMLEKEFEKPQKIIWFIINNIDLQSIDCNVYKQGAKTMQYRLEIITHKYNYD